MAMYSSSVVKQKLMAEVDVTLSDGSILNGNFFLNPQERIIDMLNDDRHFLPFSDSDGVITVVAKVAITSIRPTQQTDDGKTEEPPCRIGM
ncbi:MAG: hypothetical protein VCD33_05140 [Alphaproteobacteria bacterium]